MDFRFLVCLRKAVSVRYVSDTATGEGKRWSNLERRGRIDVSGRQHMMLGRNAGPTTKRGEPL